MQELIRSNDTTAIRKIDVVARATPDQKLLLVRALKDAGEIVAVTGDGVNDVPALQTCRHRRRHGRTRHTQRT